MTTDSRPIGMNNAIDKMAIDLGRQRPGAQPGRWRLNMGRCAVGALARSRTPQQVRTRERQERGGPQAKIVDLKTNTGGGGIGIRYVGSIGSVTKQSS